MTLFINCCARKDSRTKKIADALLAKLGDYKERNLYETNLQPIDETRLNRRYELLEKNELNAEEFSLAREFASADRIVIAAPFWDLSFPAKLKLYIENIYITGIVSAYGADGMPKGLCKAEKLWYVTTAGGPYDPRYSFDYIDTLCRNYLGIRETELIKAEMLDVFGSNPDEIINNTIEKL